MKITRNLLQECRDFDWLEKTELMVAVFFAILLIIVGTNMENTNLKCNSYQYENNVTTYYDDYKDICYKSVDGKYIKVEVE